MDSAPRHPWTQRPTPGLSDPALLTDRTDVAEVRRTAPARLRGYRTGLAAWLKSDRPHWRR
ncbi:hypothetical protein [Kibdelosporangium philippinense]|uniref:hypothetical protein n=1 Tax=Kibdelosporangium philippinense TaxID=211113 RepID=UPI00360F5B7B